MGCRDIPIELKKVLSDILGGITPEVNVFGHSYVNEASDALKHS